jgi:hypothetical protein
MAACIANRFVYPLYILAMISLAAGCSNDECASGEQRCDGRTQLTCMELSCHVPGCTLNRGRSWARKECSGACVEVKELAFCALSAEQDPVCQRTDRCDDNTAVDCLGGYAIVRRPCRSAVCVTTDRGEPLCAQSSEREPRCASLARGLATCADATLLTCDQGYVLDSRVCPGACIALDAQQAFCADSSSPDPRCDVAAGEAPDVSCSDGSLAACREGYVECFESFDPDAAADAGSG